MAINDFSWTETAGEIDGPKFERFQTELAKYNSRQLQPAFPTECLARRAGRIRQGVTR